MKREQLLTLILTIVAVLAIIVVLKPRMQDTEYSEAGFGSNARPVYVGGEQKAPAHSAEDVNNKAAPEAAAPEVEAVETETSATPEPVEAEASEPSADVMDAIAPEAEVEEQVVPETEPTEAEPTEAPASIEELIQDSTEKKMDE